MRISRRNLGIMLPALAIAASARAQTPKAPRPKLTVSKMYHHDVIAYTGDETKKARRFFTGETHGGFNLEVHETILAAGVQTHAPHQHVHEEIIVVVEGTVETFVDGKTEVVETGSVIYYGSSQMHSLRNVGRTRARYYVIELRGDEDVAPAAF